jgi:hypothetical protein
MAALPTAGTVTAFSLPATRIAACCLHFLAYVIALIFIQLPVASQLRRIRSRILQSSKHRYFLCCGSRE